jgi:hypothetical protein
MLSKVSLSPVLVAALLVSATQLPAAPCALSNTPSEKACAPACCANKTCCETSHRNTASPLQPLAKSGSDQQNIVTLPATVGVAVLDHAAPASSVFSSAQFAAHSPLTLALICIRLI